MVTESILTQLRRIIGAMRASGRRPLRIYLTYTQLQAVKDELIRAYHYDPIVAHKMELLGIPLQLAEAGTSLWVSCVSDLEDK